MFGKNKRMVSNRSIIFLKLTKPTCFFTNSSNFDFNFIKLPRNVDTGKIFTSILLWNTDKILLQRSRNDLTAISTATGIDFLNEFNEFQYGSLILHNLHFKPLKLLIHRSKHHPWELSWEVHNVFWFVIYVHVSNFLEEGMILFYLLSHIFWGGFLFLFCQKPNRLFNDHSSNNI